MQNEAINHDKRCRSRLDWIRLESGWKGSRVSQRSRKRKFHTIFIEYPFLNRELLRYAMRQSEGYFSARQVYHEVENGNGTVAAIDKWVNEKKSEFIVVQSSSSNPGRVSEQPSSDTVSNSSGPSSDTATSNPFGALSSTDDDEEDDESHSRSTSDVSFTSLYICSSIMFVYISFTNRTIASLFTCSQHTTEC